MSEWRTIDSAPVGEPVLIYGFDEYGQRPITAVAKFVRGIAPMGNSFSRWDVEGCAEWEVGEIACEPTHWQPKPPPPDSTP